MLGKHGLRVAEVVAVDNLLERENVSLPNARILFTEDVRGNIMKKEDAMNNAAQKSHTGVHGHPGLPVARAVEEESSIERENVFHHAVHTLILNTTSVMDLSMKKGSAMNSVAKRNHTGVNGKIGLLVARAVEVEYHIEKGPVIHLNVHIPIIKPAMEKVVN